MNTKTIFQIEATSAYPLISIMIAVYNTEKYLERCIESVLNQSYKNIEIILINDGSTDNSIAICKKYETNYEQVKLINKENGGLSDARNVGLSIARGKFFGFVDSDDYINESMYERLFLLLREHDADIVNCNYWNDENPKKNQVYNEILSKQVFLPLLLEDKISSHIWKNLFKAELFQGVSFPLGYTAQDMLVMPEVFIRAGIVVRTSEQLYFYNYSREDNNSNLKSNLLVGTIARAKAFEERYIISDHYKFDNRFQILKKAVRFTIASYCRQWLGLNSHFTKDYVGFHMFVKNYFKVILRTQEISLIEKFAIVLLRMNPGFFVSICKFFRIR